MLPSGCTGSLGWKQFRLRRCAVGHAGVRHPESRHRPASNPLKGAALFLIKKLADQKSLPHRRSMGKLSFSSPLRTSPGANSGQIRRSRGHHFKLQPQSRRQHVSGRRKEDLVHQPALHAWHARHNPVCRVAHSGRARTSKRPATSPAGSGGRPRWRSPQLCRHCQARQRP